MDKAQLEISALLKLGHSDVNTFKTIDLINKKIYVNNI